MKKLTIKSALIGVLFTTTVLLGLASCAPMGPGSTNGDQLMDVNQLIRNNQIMMHQGMTGIGPMAPWYGTWQGSQFRLGQ